MQSAWFIGSGRDALCSISASRRSSLPAIQGGEASIECFGQLAVLGGTGSHWGADVGGGRQAFRSVVVLLAGVLHEGVDLRRRLLGAPIEPSSRLQVRIAVAISVKTPDD
jgi:hypothetical protein